MGGPGSGRRKGGKNSLDRKAAKYRLSNAKDWQKKGIKMGNEVKKARGNLRYIKKTGQ